MESQKLCTQVLGRWTEEKGVMLDPCPSSSPPQESWQISALSLQDQQCHSRGMIRESLVMQGCHLSSGATEEGGGSSLRKG